MRKIFYRSENLEIMGMSDGDNSMQFPFIEVEEDYFALSGMKLVKEGEKIVLIINEEYPTEANIQ